MPVALLGSPQTNILKTEGWHHVNQRYNSKIKHEAVADLNEAVLG